jgi:putative lipoic acid-binding regulatory protein
MLDNRSNGNHEKKITPGLPGSKKLKFPVSYHLKAVLEASLGEEQDKKNLESVFISQKVPYSFIEQKPSSKGNYISYTYKVTLHNEQQLDALYNELKGVTGLKFAL